MAKGDIKRRREVERLSASLPSITDAQRWEAQSLCGTAWIGAKKGWCDVCGREFESDLWDNSRKKITVCPKCGARLSVKRSPGKKKEVTRYYFHVVTTAGDWQVVRTFYCNRMAKRTEWFGNEVLNPSDVYLGVTEVFQKWFKAGIRPMIIGLGLRGMHYYADQWNWDSGWKLRRDYLTAYTVWGWVSRDVQILPELKMKGLKKISDGSSPYAQIANIWNDWRSEVMLKAGAVRLYDKFCGRDDYKVRSNWESIRIALRHRYHTRIRDWGMYFDYIKLLRKNGKDLHNPHYICPQSLKAAHDEILKIEERRQDRVRRERERQEAIRLAEKLSEDGKTNVEYIERMGKVLGVIVKSKDITLKPLQNIQEFFDEGSTLNHCVFRNGYYRHKDCLIIGARVKGKRTETIEVDMKEWKIVQCRGKHNQPSKYHTQIMRLMNANMNKFKTAAI